LSFANFNADCCGYHIVADCVSISGEPSSIINIETSHRYNPSSMALSTKSVDEQSAISEQHADTAVGPFLGLLNHEAPSPVQSLHYSEMEDHIASGGLVEDDALQFVAIKTPVKSSKDTKQENRVMKSCKSPRRKW
jgi:hypothetical protein